MIIYIGDIEVLLVVRILNISVRNCDAMKYETSMKHRDESILPGIVFNIKDLFKTF